MLSLFDVINYVIKFHGYFLHIEWEKKVFYEKFVETRLPVESSTTWTSCCCLKFICCQDKQAINCNETTSTEKNAIHICRAKQNQTFHFVVLRRRHALIYRNAIATVQNEIKQEELNRKRSTSPFLSYTPCPNVVIMRVKVYWSHWIHHINDNYSNDTWRQQQRLNLKRPGVFINLTNTNMNTSYSKKKMERYPGGRITKLEVDWWCYWTLPLPSSVMFCLYLWQSICHTFLPYLL